MHLKITNGIPAKYTLGQLRRDNSNTSFPKQIPDTILESYGVYPYVIQDVEYDRLTQTKTEGDFVKVDGEWTLFMVAEDLPLDKAEKRVRSMRDGLLSECDWTQVADASVDKAVWATYRQALRDITDQSGFPFNVTWPTTPTEG